MAGPCALWVCGVVGVARVRELCDVRHGVYFICARWSACDGGCGVVGRMWCACVSCGVEPVKVRNVE